MVSPKQQKTQFSQSEAAAELGISLDQLRSLIRNHLVKSDEELTAASFMSFQPSDLLLLRILAHSGTAAMHA